MSADNWTGMSAWVEAGDRTVDDRPDGRTLTGMPRAHHAHVARPKKPKRTVVPKAKKPKPVKRGSATRAAGTHKIVQATRVVR